MTRLFLRLCPPLFLLFACATAGAGTLHDFSQPLPRAAALPVKKQKELVDRIFPRRLQDEKRCASTGRPAKVPGVMRKTVCFPLSGEGVSGRKPKPDCLADVVIPQPDVDMKTGNFTAALAWAVIGSFTGTGRKEEAALVDVDYCSGGGAKTLAIFSEGKVVHSQEIAFKAPPVSEPYANRFEYGTGAKATDVNGDGRDEILTTTDFYATMDVDRSYATLWTLNEGRKPLWEQVATFENPTTSRCDVYYEENQRYFEAKVITYRRTASGKMPNFSETTKSLKCP